MILEIFGFRYRFFLSLSHLKHYLLPRCRAKKKNITQGPIFLSYIPNLAEDKSI